MSEREVLKSAAGKDTCDFCREKKDEVAIIGPFAMELPTHICATCYHECILEFTDLDNDAISDLLDRKKEGENMDETSGNIGWKIITEIHGRSLRIKESDSSDNPDGILDVGDLPDDSAEYTTVDYSEIA
jgi:hypothetical protein